MSIPSMNNNPLFNLIPAEEQRIIGEYLEQNGINLQDPQTVNTTIRSIAKQFFPVATTLIDHQNITISYDPNGTHLLVCQEKNNVEKFHYWLVKGYDFNFDTLFKVVVICLIIASWGAAYFAALAVALIKDCIDPTPKRIELF